MRGLGEFAARRQCPVSECRLVCHTLGWQSQCGLCLANALASPPRVVKAFARHHTAGENCMTKLELVLDQIGKNFASSLSRYIEFLRIPSVSTDPAYKEHVKKAGAWLKDEFSSLGFTAQLHETAGHPILLAHYENASPDAPHLLYYGHYDVQPPEPLELWETPPFEPAIVNGPHGERIIARGAVDDKGQVMTF